MGQSFWLQEQRIVITITTMIIINFFIFFKILPSDIFVTIINFIYIHDSSSIVYSRMVPNISIRVNTAVVRLRIAISPIKISFILESFLYVINMKHQPFFSWIPLSIFPIIAHKFLFFAIMWGIGFGPIVIDELF